MMRKEKNIFFMRSKTAQLVTDNLKDLFENNLDKSNLAASPSKLQKEDKNFFQRLSKTQTMLFLVVILMLVTLLTLLTI